MIGNVAAIIGSVACNSNLNSGVAALCDKRRVFGATKLPPRKAIAACDPHRKTTGTQNHTRVMADRNMTSRFMTGKRKARRSRACDAFRFSSGVRPCSDRFP
jgi:hypothetical protein